MANVLNFIKESYVEITEKVTWPTWSQLQNHAVVVLVASLIIALLVFAMDKASSNVLELLYGTTSKNFVEYNIMAEQSLKWYVVRAVSGKEKKVKQYIEAEVKRLGIQHLVPQVLIPMEKYYQM